MTNATDARAIRQLRHAANNLREEPHGAREQNRRGAAVALAMANFFEFGNAYNPQLSGELAALGELLDRRGPLGDPETSQPADFERAELWALAAWCWRERSEETADAGQAAFYLQRSLGCVRRLACSDRIRELAKQILGLETLERRGSDSLDFAEVSVGDVKLALLAAFELGRISASKAKS